MMGTLAAVLAGKKIRTFSDLFSAEVIGEIEDVNGTMKITRIRVKYQLKAPKEKHDEARAALDNYVHLCPAAQSVIGCIAIDHEMELTEA
jgi:organic hydroperoxide reductase OsmC/OhrA